MINYAYSSYSKTGYTQSDEETYILKNAGGKGRFLDIGAYDGKTFSNTRALLEKGWSGAYVEPCPVALAKLKENSKPYAERLIIFPAAVSSKDGKALFHPCNEMVGTLCPEGIARWQKIGIQFTDPIEVRTITPTTLLHSVGKDFDMISIDVEGMNQAIFDLTPWEELKPKVIVVEHDAKGRPPVEIIRRLPLYRVVHGNKENVIFVRKEDLK